MLEVYQIFTKNKKNDTIFLFLFWLNKFHTTTYCRVFLNVGCA